MRLQHIFDLVQIAYLKGVRHAVISPGSRNAALTIALVRHPHIQCFSIPDERSAAFIALGMSLKTQVPTLLICTSGSAVLNYAPAVAEAYFSRVPLLICTADRPPEWIDQQEGQTIFQSGLFGKHAKASYDYPSLDDSASARWFAQRTANEAVNACLSEPQGPIHVNIPCREPFYPSPHEVIAYPKSPKLISQAVDQAPYCPPEWIEECQDQSILVVIGQGRMQPNLTHVLSRLSKEKNIVVVGDILSNQHEVDDIVRHHDTFLAGLDDEAFIPDLLITSQLSVLSKHLKHYLRKHHIKAHWHIGKAQEAADTFQALTKVIRLDPITLFLSLAEHLQPHDKQSAYQALWADKDTQVAQSTPAQRDTSLHEMTGYTLLMRRLPDHIDLHLANSLAVRHANRIGLKGKKGIEVFCNRGTSGIDSSNGSAVGSAMMSDKPTLLVTGDMAFLYDKNAFWHHHLPQSLHIIVFNNQGGGIFRMIEGPAEQPELEQFFQARHHHTAKGLAEIYGYDYTACRTLEDFRQALDSLFTKGGHRQIIEIFTDIKTNPKV